jgi:hypothetical protein
MPITTSTVGTTTTFTPAEILYDPTNKLRVAQPESLIDTDFEYGQQTTKWENLATVNNMPFAYPSPNVIPNISSMQFVAGSKQVIVTLGSGVAPANGTPIFVQDALLTPANGNFVIETGGGTTVWTYKARATNNSAFTAIFDASKTTINTGLFFTNAQINPTGSYIVNTSSKAVTVTTPTPHGLALGNEIQVTGITGTNPPNGAFEVATLNSPTSFTYLTDGGVPSSLSVGSMNLYVRPSAQFQHRPFDGGVIFSSNGNSNFETAIRQTRRYFRYQSGKGLQISSGTILKPALQVDSITSSGTTVTVQVKERHNLWTGAGITVSGVSNDSTYNGSFTVASVISYNRFTYTVATTPPIATATGPFIVSVNSWYGAVNRLGLFDEQNGVFFEFNGQTLSVVRRTSTFQLPGRYTFTNGSDQVVRTTSAFPTQSMTQLEIGNYIVARGQSYRVHAIADDNTITITPAYRGSTATMVQVTKTVDTKIPQSSWNLDKMDGTGTSGYNIDLTKMQMFYIDYTWYGAGAIRYGFRATDGTVTYCHRIANNNTNSEAYMRSGNLPARYESRMEPPVTKLGATLQSGDGTMTVVSTADFPSAGTLMVRNNTQIEFVNYTGKSATQFTGLSRSKAGIPAGVATTVTSGSNIVTVASTTNLQVGQKVYDLTNGYVPEGGYIQSITNSTTFVLSVAVTGANPTLTIPPMDIGSPQVFTFTSLTASPILVELSQPTFAPTISHWGTSVIMDGTFDEDKSLIFTYGQSTLTALGGSGGTTQAGATTNTSATVTLTAANSNIIIGQTVTGTGIQSGTLVQNIVGTTLTLSLPATATGSPVTLSFSGLQTKALLSIRVAPSVDNGIGAAFGVRELINRMQLKLDSIGVTTASPSSNYLVTAVLNGLPSSSTSWTSPTNNSTVLVNSSLAQIADYAGGTTTVSGGEIAGGFLSQGTDRISLATLRDLGNAIMGGGSTLANQQIFPDGPDVLTILVTNLTPTAISVAGRVSWTEAQA